MSWPASDGALRLECRHRQPTRLYKRLSVTAVLRIAKRGITSNTIELERGRLPVARSREALLLSRVLTGGVLLLVALLLTGSTSVDEGLSLLGAGKLVEAANKPAKLTCETSRLELLEHADQTRTTTSSGSITCAIDSRSVCVEHDDLVDAGFLRQADGSARVCAQPQEKLRR